jgi:hypothetical protein
MLTHIFQIYPIVRKKTNSFPPHPLTGIIDDSLIISLNMKRVASQEARHVFDSFLGRSINITFGENSPAMVEGNFYAAKSPKPASKKRRVSPSFPPVTVEEIIDLEDVAGATEKTARLPTVSDPD